MMACRKPTTEALRKLSEQLRSAALTYVSLDGLPPRGFRGDQFAIPLGSGAAVFEAARLAIQQWKMFPSVMAELWPARQSIEVGQIVHVLFRAGPLWTANPARILRVVDSSDERQQQFGFTYGTLPGHVESGEETFQVTWDRGTNVVTYSISLFSRPAHWLIWLGYPYARMEQARFRRLSGAAMLAATCNRDPQP